MKKHQDHPQSLVRGHLFIIIAPSGTGKSSLIKRLRQEMSMLQWSVSHTTRPMREGEQEGVDYYFVTEDQFRASVEDHQFIEWAKVHNHYYGTSVATVQASLQKHQCLLFDLDIQGARNLLRLFRNLSTAIFIAPPSLQVLRERLQKRGSETAEQLELRLNNAIEELNHKNEFDYLVINDDFEQSYGDLKNIISSVLGQEQQR